MLRESFHQLGRLQEECNRELSDFQRENFIAHEEFRAISVRLCQTITDFQASINDELDKLSVRINQLEITALYVVQPRCERVLSVPGAKCMTSAGRFLVLAMETGEIRTHDVATLAAGSSVTRAAYDPVGAHGKMTQLYARDRVFAGFAGGAVIAFALGNVSRWTEMRYHTAPVTAIHQLDECVATGCAGGIVVLWRASTLERLAICSAHFLAIAAIIDNGAAWVVVDCAGGVLVHDPLFARILNRFKICPSIKRACRHGATGIVTVSDRLLMWDGRRVLKTFNAVPVDAAPVCCLKEPELLVIGSQASTEIRFVCLESLLFPKTVDVLDAPPRAIVQHSARFYVLTTSGSVFAIATAV